MPVNTGRGWLTELAVIGPWSDLGGASRVEARLGRYELGRSATGGLAADQGTRGERGYRMAESRRMGKTELFTHFAERFGIKRSAAP